MDKYVSDIAFTRQVKAEQERRGSRSGYAVMEEKRGWRSKADDSLRAFLTERDSFYFATSSSDGQPYIQHRGGPKGLLRVLDDSTLAFADYSGNRQYITVGNLAENPKAFIFLMDYPNRRRIKIWGQARIIEDDPELLRQLAEEGYKSTPERAVLFTLLAWDINCPQHITPRYDEDTVARALHKMTQRIEELEAEITRLRGAAS